jgi:hypothetical protein
MAVPPKVTGARTDEMLYDLLEVRIIIKLVTGCTPDVSVLIYAQTEYI